MADRRVTLDYDLSKDFNIVSTMGVYTHVTLFNSNPPKWWQFWKRGWKHRNKLPVTFPLTPQPLMEGEAVTLGNFDGLDSPT